MDTKRKIGMNTIHNEHNVLVFQNEWIMTAIVSFVFCILRITLVSIRQK